MIETMTVDLALTQILTAAPYVLPLVLLIVYQQREIAYWKDQAAQIQIKHLELLQTLAGVGMVAKVPESKRADLGRDQPVL